MSKRPKLAYRQRTTANKNNREETSSIVEYEYTGRDHHVPNNVTHVRIHPSVTEIENYAFHHRGSLKEVVLNEGLSVIGYHAFSYCYSLQSITLPSTITKIGTYAFNLCSSLSEVMLNEGLQKIGAHAFHDCTALQSITIPSTVIEYAFIGCNSLREVVLSEGLTVIGNTAFQDCTSLQSINIPSTVDDIGNFAFNNCTNLREVVLSDGLKKINQGVFNGCSSLENITIPSTVIKIGIFVFWGCTNLREVVIVNEKVQIGNNAFYNCTLLERFSFPSLSTRLNNVIRAGQRDIEAKMDDITAVEWRGEELIIAAVRRERDNRGRMEIIAEVDKGKLTTVKGLIRHYEIKEATTLFELALWKTKIDQCLIPSSADRAACRIEVPGPVKDAILQYLN